MSIFLRILRPIAFRRLTHPRRSCLNSFHDFSSASSKAVVADGVKESLMFDYLRRELAFCDAEILDTARRCPPLLRMRSIEKAKNLLILFKDTGCTDDQVRKALLNCPVLLKLKPENIERKLELLRSLGFTQTQLAHLVSIYPRFLSCSLDGNLKPKVEYFQRIFRGKKNLVKVLKNNPCLLALNLERQVMPKVDLLLELGIKGKLLLMLLRRHHRILSASFGSLNSYIEFVREMGIQGPSKLFVTALSSVSKTGSLQNMGKKFSVLESFGLHKDEVGKIFGKHPTALYYSTEKIQKNMEFLVRECGFPANIAVENPILLCLSLEKRLRPRYRVYEYLKRIDPYYDNISTFCTMLMLSHENFIASHVLFSFSADALVDILERAVNDNP